VDSRADLHTHTLYSDGALPPHDLVAKAASVGLNIVGVTDHDSVDGIEEATAAGEELGVQIIPGVEFSASFKDVEVHILGYFIDHLNDALREVLAAFREERLRRAERIVQKLNKMNIPLTMESVLANSGGGAVGRPHIASALVDQGHAESFRQAFNKYIGLGCPAFEKKTGLSPVDTVKLIAASGGLSFLAHPGRALDGAIVLQLIKEGLDGIEVVHPSHSPDLVKHYRGIVNEYFLLETGGSDFHGGLKDDNHLLGRIYIPGSSVDAMRRRLIRS
jgi:3',5'-nucleoside bisphosphate phosphatase